MNDVSDPAEELECPICLTTPPVAACKTRCGHVFCTECLTRAFPLETASTTGQCPLCRAKISLYSTTDISTGNLLRSPEVASPIGQCYLQGGSEGVASYHFEPDASGALSAAFISYSNAPPDWKLDDGSRPPARKHFIEPRYDAASRTFTGTIVWADGSQPGEDGASPAATFGGEARWEYTMVFSESFRIICGGGLRRYGVDGVERLPARSFPKDLVYWLQRPRPESILGSAYLQGGRVGLASYHFEAAGDGGADGDGEGSGGVTAWISYENAPPSWLLDDGNRPPQRVPFVDARYDAATRVFTGTVRWEPATFHGDARWECTRHLPLARTHRTRPVSRRRDA